MPDQINNNNEGNTGYSAEYVKSLRDEAASWRTKLRDVELIAKTNEEKAIQLEASIAKQNINSSINAELKSRSLEIDPDFIKLEKDQSPKDAVDNFLKKYPQFGIVKDVPPVPPVKGKIPMPPNPQNSNVENVNISELSSIKKDPIARAKLRELYKGLLAHNAGTSQII